jgi:hypothetical protein
MSLPTLAIPYSRSLWLRGCLSLGAITLLLLIAVGALAVGEIRAGRMAPLQGVVGFGPATLTAKVVDCPDFPYCIVHVPPGDTTPLPDRVPVQYIIEVGLPSMHAFYRVFDVWLEGDVGWAITPDY